MQTSYPESIAFVLRQEGGYSNHPADPGGPTNFGITINDARSYWKTGATAEDVKAMPLSVAKQIYKTKYWDKVLGDRLPAGLDLCTFDSGVNSGTARSNLWLAKSIGSTAKDYPTLATQAAQVKDVPKSVKSYCQTRLSFLHGLKTWSVFGKGWGRRVSELQALALSLALRGQGLTPLQTKAVLKTEVSKTEGDANTAKTAGGTIGAGTTGGAVATWQWDWIHFGLIAAGVGAAIFLALYIVNKKNQVSAYNDEIARLEAVAAAEAKSGSV